MRDRFPVLTGYYERKAHPEWPTTVPWAWLAPHEEWAQENHDQSLETLARRCGLDLTEMAAIVEHRKWRMMTDEEIAAFIKTIPAV